MNNLPNIIVDGHALVCTLIKLLFDIFRKQIIMMRRRTCHSQSQSSSSWSPCWWWGPATLHKAGTKIGHWPKSTEFHWKPDMWSTPAHHNQHHHVMVVVLVVLLEVGNQTQICRPHCGKSRYLSLCQSFIMTIRDHYQKRGKKLENSK